MIRAWTLIVSLGLAFVVGTFLVLTISNLLAGKPGEAETLPTVVSLADFQKDSTIPADKRWLEVTDGVLLWAEAGTEVREWKLKGGQKKTTDRAVFVPLVSKKAFDIGQKSKDDLKQPIQVARVYVRFRPQEADAEEPLQEGAVDRRPKLRGMAAMLDKEPGFLREGLAPKGSLKDPAKLMVIRFNESPASASAVLFGQICVGVLGLGLCLPLGIWLLFPDWRFGQMIANVATAARGPQVEAIWDCEDEELLAAARRLLERNREREHISA